MSRYAHTRLVAEIAVIICVFLLIPALGLAYLGHARNRIYNIINPIEGELLLHSNRDGNYQIYRLTFNTGTGQRDLTQITNFPTATRNPAYSPDGTMIAFQNVEGEIAYARNPNINADWNIYLMDADGTNPRMLAQGYDPIWLPDNRHIVFSDWFTYERDFHEYYDSTLYIIDIETSIVSPLSGNPLVFPDSVNTTTLYLPNLSDGIHYNSSLIAPNRSQIAFARIYRFLHETSGIYIINEDSVYSQLLWQVHSNTLTWSPDSRYIAYDALHPDDTIVIAVYAVDGSNWYPLVGNDGFDYGHPSWRP